MGNTQTFQKARLAVIRLSVWQFLLTAGIAITGLLLVDQAFALSVVTGGMIGMLAGAYQAQRIVRIDAAQHPDAFMRGLWVSEVIKIVLTVAMFVVAIRLLRVQMVPTIVGYAGTYVIYWVALGTSYPWFETDVVSNVRDRNWPQDPD